jgi:hypothetical protein
MPKMVRSRAETAEERRRIIDAIVSRFQGEVFTTSQVADYCQIQGSSERMFVSSTLLKLAKDEVLAVQSGNGHQETKHYRIKSLRALMSKLNEPPPIKHLAMKVNLDPQDGNGVGKVTGLSAQPSTSEMRVVRMRLEAIEMRIGHVEEAVDALLQEWRGK